MKILKKVDALLSVSFIISNLKEEIKEMELWERAKAYTRVYYKGFETTPEFDSYLTELDLDSHKRVIEMRELIRQHNEINLRLLEGLREYNIKKKEEEKHNLPKRIATLEKELKEVKELMNRLVD